jgi:hypothetical protein
VRRERECKVAAEARRGKGETEGYSVRAKRGERCLKRAWRAAYRLLLRDGRIFDALEEQDVRFRRVALQRNREHSKLPLQPSQREVASAPRSSTNPGFGGSRARATRPPRRRDPSGGTWRALSAARRDCVRFCQDVSFPDVLDWRADCSCAPVFVLVVWKYRRTGGGRSKVSSRISKYSPAESKPLTRIACRIVDRLFVLLNVALLLLEVDSHLRRVLSAGEGDALRRESGNV